MTKPPPPMPSIEEELLARFSDLIPGQHFSANHWAKEVDSTSAVIHRVINSSVDCYEEVLKRGWVSVSSRKKPLWYLRAISSGRDLSKVHIESLEEEQHRLPAAGTALAPLPVKNVAAEEILHANAHVSRALGGSVKGRKVAQTITDKTVDLAVGYDAQAKAAEAAQQAAEAYRREREDMHKKYVALLEGIVGGKMGHGSGSNGPLVPS